MKVVIAPDSFKGSLSAIEVADCIEEGIRRVYPNIEIVKNPMADGGEGTVQALVDGTGGEIIRAVVRDPLFRPIESFYGILGDKSTAVIEMAAASGITLLEEKDRNPMITTTYGTGQLIKHALDKGCRDFIIGIGGSATNDGGVGMASALGVKFLSENKNEIGFGGGSLGELRSIDTSEIDKRLRECKILVCCDVDNPLFGKRGASYVYGPQKGAHAEMVKILEKNMMNYGLILEKTLGLSVMDKPGAGAAGGLGAALLGLLNAKLDMGVNMVIKVTKLEDKLQGADLVITGEGRLDAQTRFGKTPYGVAKLANKYNIPVIAIAGSLEACAEELYNYGFDGIFPIIDAPMDLVYAMDNSKRLLKNASERIMRIIKIAKSI